MDQQPNRVAGAQPRGNCGEIKNRPVRAGQLANNLSALVRRFDQTTRAIARLAERRELETGVGAHEPQRDDVAARHAGDFAIYNRTRADDRWLVGFDADTGPAAYYAFDRGARRGAFLFHNRPALAQYTLAPRLLDLGSAHPIVIHDDRDGITVTIGKDR